MFVLLYFPLSASAFPELPRKSIISSRQFENYGLSVETRDPDDRGEQHDASEQAEYAEAENAGSEMT